MHYWAFSMSNMINCNYFSSLVLYNRPFSPGSSSDGEPDSPLSVAHIHVRVGHDSESSEEENASSDSDEERSDTLSCLCLSHIYIFSVLVYM